MDILKGDEDKELSDLDSHLFGIAKENILVNNYDLFYGLDNYFI